MARYRSELQDGQDSRAVKDLLKYRNSGVAEAVSPRKHAIVLQYTGCTKSVRGTVNHKTAWNKLGLIFYMAVFPGAFGN